MYRKCKVDNHPDTKAAFKKFKKDTAKEQRGARWKYINKFVSQAFEENNTRPFWKYVKSQRQDNFGVPPLKKDGILNTDSKTKAEILRNTWE